MNEHKLSSYATRSEFFQIRQPSYSSCVYFANVHSRLRYGIIFWGKTSYSSQTVRLQKRIVRIISKSNPRDSCKSLFINLGNFTITLSLIFTNQ